MIRQQAGGKPYTDRSERAAGQAFVAAGVRLAEIVTVAMLMLVSNRKAWYCFFMLDDRKYSCEYGSAASDYVTWSLVAAGVLLLIARRGLLAQAFAAWRSNWPLAVFIGFSLLSVMWSIAPARSLHTWFILAAASLSAGGLVTLFRREQILDMLLWFTGLVALFSLVAVILLPKTAITQVEYLAGTWRGLYWHKNYLGAVMAFGNALFLLTFWQPGRSRLRRITAACLYLLTFFLVIMSQSATGLIDLVLLHGMVLGWIAWLKWGVQLSRKGHLGIGAAAAVIAAAVLLNLGRLFGLIGKTAGLTGRVPLWQYLLSEIASKRPWFGYGLETLWRDTDFWRQTGDAVGWGITVVNAHNGYLDILLYLGISGLAMFLVVLGFGLFRAVRTAAHEPGWSGFLPLLILAYVLITNIAISYFIEFESWHWVLLVLVLFMTAKSPSSNASEAAT